MKIRKLICFIFIGFLTLSFQKEVMAWNEETHKGLSQYAAENSVLELSKDNYLKKLGYENGLNEKFSWNNKSKSILLWLQDGAELEDAGEWYEIITNKGRFNNHFHNPTKTWDT